MASNTIFFNQVFDKKRLKVLIAWVFKEFGEKEALRIVEELKVIGFYNATQAGLSIGLNDLTTPSQKPSLLAEAEFDMSICDQDFNGGRITATERNQRIVDTWHRVSETLKKQVVEHFSTYDQLNPVYIMALSGARGNFSQVRQLVGMRGLMADPQGQIISFPIRSNLREGLTLTEYFISCSGARKGLVDTALRTADTGYLTRRLVDVSHHIVVKKICCNTKKGITVRALKSENKILLSLYERLVGRVLAENIEYVVDKTSPKLSETLPKLCFGRANKSREERFQSFNKPFIKALTDNKITNTKVDILASQKENQAKLDGTYTYKAEHIKKGFLAQKNQEISPTLAVKIQTVKEQVIIRSPLTCILTHSVCQLCYGWSLSQGRLVSLGEAVGVIAAQSIGEPGTQLTMRTFHTGGVFSGDLLQEIRAPHSGKIEFSKAFQGLMIRTTDGRIAFLTKTSGEIFLKKDGVETNSTDFSSEKTKPIQNNYFKGYNFSSDYKEQSFVKQASRQYSLSEFVYKPQLKGIKTKFDFISPKNANAYLKNKYNLPILAEYTASLSYNSGIKAQLLYQKFFFYGVEQIDAIVKENLTTESKEQVKNKKYTVLLLKSSQKKVFLVNKMAKYSLLYNYEKRKKNVNKIDFPSNKIEQANKQTCLQFQALSLLFVRQSEYVKKNQLLAQISILGEEGNQPIKSRQTIFAEISGKVFETKGAVRNKKFVKNINKLSKNAETIVFKNELVNTLKGRAYTPIQPEKSSKLGFFHILATQVSATFESNNFQKPAGIQSHTFKSPSKTKFLQDKNVVFVREQSSLPKQSFDKSSKESKSKNIRVLTSSSKTKFLYDNKVVRVLKNPKSKALRVLTNPDNFVVRALKSPASRASSYKNFVFVRGLTTLSKTKFLQDNKVVRVLTGAYTAQFFSSTHNKNLILSLVRKQIYKAKELKISKEENLSEPKNFRKLQSFSKASLYQNQVLVRKKQASNFTASFKNTFDSEAIRVFTNSKGKVFRVFKNQLIQDNKEKDKIKPFYEVEQQLKNCQYTRRYFSNNISSFTPYKQFEFKDLKNKRFQNLTNLESKALRALKSSASRASSYKNEVFVGGLTTPNNEVVRILKDPDSMYKNQAFDSFCYAKDQTAKRILKTTANLNLAKYSEQEQQHDINSLFLQTIAQEGDLVDSNYKNVCFKTSL